MNHLKGQAGYIPTGNTTAEFLMTVLYNSPHFKEALRRLLRSQMALKDFSYQKLAEKLAQLGVSQTPSTLRTKVNTGTMGAQLFLAIQLAMGVKTLRLDSLEEVLDEINEDDVTL